MKRIALIALVLALIACAGGCRFSSEKYWGLPSSYGLHNAMERGYMPEGWGYLYPVTAILDVVLLPFTTLHDLIILLIDPPSSFTWEEDRERRQMIHGY